MHTPMSSSRSDVVLDSFCRGTCQPRGSKWEEMLLCSSSRENQAAAALEGPGMGKWTGHGAAGEQIQSLPSSACSSRLPLPWKRPLTTSPSLDITPCVSSLSLGHYSPYLTLGLFFKLATPSSLKLFCLLNNVICSVDYPCTSNTSPLKSLSSTCIFVLGAHFYSLSR